MQRGPSTKAPSYRLHKASGQARVTINGKTHYLGKYDSEASVQKYKQLLADHWSPPGAPPKPEPREPSSSVTVGRLAVEYAKDVKRKHGDDSNEWKQVRLKPNQLRKSAATTARKQMDLETAQIVLGHSSKKTTERFYAEIDNERAVEFARKFG